MNAKKLASISRRRGLGLYIAQQIVIAHGGDMTVESEAGKGTTFHAYLVRFNRRMRNGDQ